MSAHRLPVSHAELPAVTRQALFDLIRQEAYGYLDESAVATPWFQQLAAAEAYQRYETAGRHFVPWLQRRIGLHGTSVLEIGCGGGSLTAALAPHVRWVHAYDIHAAAITTTTSRMAIMGLDNFAAACFEEAEFLDQVVARHRTGIDIVMLNAVLEHMPVASRLRYLRALWDLLPPGGCIVVGDTPNRLIYSDRHTSDLPFFDLLPDELAVRYAERSPRADFRERIATALAQSPEEAQRQLTSAGRGASFHEFELALGGRLNELVIADGYDPEILSLGRPTEDEDGLKAYWRRRRLDVPAAFTRHDLYLILQKEGSSTPVVDLPQAPDVVSFDNAVQKEQQWVLLSAGASITFELPSTPRQFVLGTLHHEWSGRVILKSENGEVLLDEELHAPVMEQRYREVNVPPGVRRVIAKAAPVKRARGSEVWLTYLGIR